jgi:type II secretory pathway component PulF
MAEQDEPTAARLSTKDAAVLSEQIAGLTRAGLPLASGLQALGAELPRGKLRRMLGAVSRSLTQGASLDQAIAAQGTALPAHLRGLVLAGQRTGRTAEVLARFAGYVQIGAQVRRQLWLSLVYPVASIVLAVALLLFALIFLVSGFEQIFADFGIPLPLLSRGLIAVSNGIREKGYTLAEAGVVLGTIGVLAMVAFGPAVRRSVISRVPLVGPVWTWTSLAEFCHLLGLLLESEIPLAEAVPLAGAGVVDADIQAGARVITADLARGESLGKVIGRRSYFPAALGPIVAWAEQHQSLAEALHVLGEMFEGRARSQASFASMVFTALTVLLILFGVSAVVFGIFVPLLQMIQKLSG